MQHKGCWLLLIPRIEELEVEIEMVTEETEVMEVSFSDWL